MTSYTSPFRSLLLAFVAALLLSACATGPVGEAPADRPRMGTVLRSYRLDRAFEDRILALNPERVTDQDLRTTLANAPAPRIVLLHGGIYPVHLVMESTGRFLARMGYPEKRIRDAHTNEWSYSPYDESSKIAGLLAWDYEHTGLRPMMIGHSQGGMQAVKVLRDLAGQFHTSIAVFNGNTHDFEDRSTIVDPYLGRSVPVMGGVTVAYTSVVGAGGAAFLLPNQWNMIGKLRSIPNSVADFTGFFITADMVAWDLLGPTGGDTYRHNGTANVRNVQLPVTYNHVFVPAVGELAEDQATRDWLNAYYPDSKAEVSRLPLEAQQHVLWAGDVWYDIKKHWVQELQRLVRARRNLVVAPPQD
jgi:hypothetical protein